MKLKTTLVCRGEWKAFPYDRNLTPYCRKNDENSNITIRQYFGFLDPISTWEGVPTPPPILWTTECPTV